MEYDNDTLNTYYNPSSKSYKQNFYKKNFYNKKDLHEMEEQIYPPSNHKNFLNLSDKQYKLLNFILICFILVFLYSILESPSSEMFKLVR